MNRKMSILMGACLIMLAGCGQSEQTTKSGEQQTSTSTTAESGPASTGKEPSGDKAYEGTISGVISDSMCKSDHSGMGDLGKDPVACTQKCVESGSKYVLVDAGGQVYSLSNQKLKEHAGKNVAISGHIDPQTKAIHVHSITAQ